MLRMPAGLHAWGLISCAFACALVVVAGACGDSLHLDPGAAPTSGKGGSGTTSSSSSTSSSGGQGGGGGHAPPVACASNADCPAPAAVCDAVRGMCVECLVIADCAFEPGTVCSKGSCKCPTVTDAYCPASGGGSGYCADLQGSSSDCGQCGTGCYGACAKGKCVDAWRPTSIGPKAPTPRQRHVAVWTGTKMVVWGGDTASGPTNTGGIYDPKTDAWEATSTANAPSPRSGAIGVWTGSKMLVWGGHAAAPEGTGGVFDPSTNTWKAMAILGAPSPRWQHAGAWANGKLIVWGGTDDTDRLGNGGVYDPGADAWTPMSGVNAPVARVQHSAVYAGTRVIIWGGYGEDPPTPVDYLGNGAAYDPVGNGWTTLNAASAPGPRGLHAAAWTGSVMVVWGGTDATGPLGNGAAYDPIGDAWSSLAGVQPSPRLNATGVWVKTPARFVAWGGEAQAGVLGSGGAYDSMSNSWKTLPTGPLARSRHTAVSTDTLLIVWGGSGASGLLGSGGILDLSIP